MSVVETQGHQIQAHQRRGKPQRDAAQPCRVLVVEDEALICVETADTFEQHGFEVHASVSGEDAMRLLHEGLQIDILFTDVNLAGRMNGVALAELARDMNPTLVVVYTSGTVNASAAGVPGAPFIAKPYNPDKVARMLERLALAHA